MPFSSRKPLVRCAVPGLGWRAPAIPRGHRPTWDRPTPRRTPSPPAGAATMDSQTSQPSQASQPPHTFHVDLRGLVDLLSHHLYSSPKVYLRELLQNAVDAVTARRATDPSAPGRIRLEVDGAGLRVSDTGIGLTEADVHQFLATIGRSSKRDAVAGL